MEGQFITDQRLDISIPTKIIQFHLVTNRPQGPLDTRRPPRSKIFSTSSLYLLVLIVYRTP